MKRFVFLATLMLLPLPALAQDGAFDGDWAVGDPMTCSMSGSDPENFALRIRGDQFRGLENQCTMTNPLTVPGIGAVIYEMECAGEGQRSSHRALFMMDRDGQLVMISEGSARTYPRCEGYIRPQPEHTAAPAQPSK